MVRTSPRVGVWEKHLFATFPRVMGFEPTPLRPAPSKEIALLTESTVEQMFRKLMNDPQRDEDMFDKAEELIEDELRPESPLRHRLSTELDELRLLATKT